MRARTQTMSKRTANEIKVIFRANTMVVLILILVLCVRMFVYSFSHRLALLREKKTNGEFSLILQSLLRSAIEKCALHVTSSH